MGEHLPSIIIPTAESAEAAAVKARAAGMTVFEGHPEWLLLDLDSIDALARFQFLMPFAHKHFGAVELQRWKSKSGKGWHVQVQVDAPLPAAWRIALQAALGSDPFREIASIKCLHNGLEEPSLLFKPATPLVVSS